MEQEPVAHQSRGLQIRKPERKWGHNMQGTFSHVRRAGQAVHGRSRASRPVRRASRGQKGILHNPGKGMKSEKSGSRYTVSSKASMQGKISSRMKNRNRLGTYKGSR